MVYQSVPDGISNFYNIPQRPGVYSEQTNYYDALGQTASAEQSQLTLSKSMPRGQLRRRKVEWDRYKNCVYTNPNYDYKKSQFMYNKKYSRPGFVECNENATGVQA